MKLPMRPVDGTDARALKCVLMMFFSNSCGMWVSTSHFPAERFETHIAECIAKRFPAHFAGLAAHICLHFPLNIGKNSEVQRFLMCACVIDFAIDLAYGCFEHSHANVVRGSLACDAHLNCLMLYDFEKP